VRHWGSAEAVAEGLLSAASRKIADIALYFLKNWIPTYSFIADDFG